MSQWDANSRTDAEAPGNSAWQTHCKGHFHTKGLFKADSTAD